ncbi:hypothetical protein BGX26_001650 [Mortierella sp. AD094]|nr:hypothetical protein BGX26_001650 [Mortierella sp. AD094]
MSATYNNKAEDIDGPYEANGPSQQSTFNEKKSRKGILSVNPVKAVSKGVTEGISQVEKGVNLAGNTLTKVPGVKHGVSFFTDYRKFMDRGNVIDLAVAVVVGAAFTSYPTRDLAHAAGDITWNWGNFLQTVINFFIISGCVFLIVKIYQAGCNTKTEVTEKPCDYCFKKIPIKAVRCPDCTTWLDWDACTKTANMERIAASGGIKPPVDTFFVDTPAQSSLNRF